MTDRTDPWVKIECLAKRLVGLKGHVGNGNMLALGFSICVRRCIRGYLSGKVLERK